MTDSTNDPGFRVTLKDVYNDVQDLKKIVAERLPDDMPARVRRLEVQMGAQWVIVSIVIATVGALVSQALTQ